MNFLKTILKAIGLFLLIVVLWCGSVLGAVYLVERHRMQDQDCWNEMAWMGKAPGFPENPWCNSRPLMDSNHRPTA